MTTENTKPVLVIPSAKFVPEELQFLGKLPAIIYPVNQKIMFDHLYGLYKDKCSRIVVSCYEGMEAVKNALSACSGEGIVLRELPELRDLGYSVYCSIRDVDAPVIINFADTIVFDEIPDEKNIAFYSEDYYADEWTYFTERDGQICEIFDKVPVDRPGKGKMFVGLFHIADAQGFARCLERAFAEPAEGVGSFYQALRLYSEHDPLHFVPAENWFDIGHIDKYYGSMLEVKAREFNHITIDRDRGILKKTSDDKKKLINEIKWYLKLPANLEYAAPRIFSYSLAYDSPFVSMEYYSYHTVHELFLYSSLDRFQWNNIFDRIRFVYSDLKRYSIAGENFVPALEDVYLKKTSQRLAQLASSPDFAPFFTKPMRINGIRYCPLHEISRRLTAEIPRRLFDVKSFNIIHGDLCFSNILIDSNLSFVKLLDPRGSFGEYDIYGDSRYDLAKLMHSVDGKYDYIIKDMFAIVYDRDTAGIDLKIRTDERSGEIYRLFMDAFSDEIGDKLKEIELIEALLFLSMIPLHSESLDHQMAMLATGIEVLDRVLDIRQR